MRVTQGFGVNHTGIPDFYTRHGLFAHEGVDFAGAEGDPVFAAASGTVKVIARDDGEAPYGNHIRVRHVVNGQEYTTIYAHLRGFVPGLIVGDDVNAGQKIGFMGRSGNVVGGGAHLHFGLLKRGATARGEKQLVPSGERVVYQKDVINPSPYFVV